MKKQFFSLFSFACLFISAYAQDEQTPEPWDTFPDTWVAVDELGRKVAVAGDGVDRPEVDPNTTIGMFYYVWHGAHPSSGKDISVLLQENPDNPDWGGENSMHWGSKPWLGYYSAGNPYIVAKHMQMLVDAGIDFIFFDYTNATYYNPQVTVVMEELLRRKNLGMKYPKACFMVYNSPEVVMASVRSLWYRNKPQYAGLWFEYDGKPLALAPEDKLVAANKTAILNDFTIRTSWAWLGGKEKTWSWLDFYPQKCGWANKYDPEYMINRKVNEQMSVSVAQHATTKIGKSYHNGKQPKIDKYGMCAETPYGLYFQEQWDEAIRVHPPLIMVTQFNEWIAQRSIIRSTAQYGDVRPGATAKIGESIFVDVYSPEFSRDLEPSSHPSVRDNYYLQLVSNARRYRGAAQIPAPTRSLDINVNGDFSQWDEEIVEYRDDKADTQYTSTDVQTPETLSRPTNDIIRAKVSKNAEMVFFYVETMEPLSDFATSPRWMRLLINADCDYTTGWNGYDYMAYRDEATGKYSLMKSASTGEFKWTTLTDLDWRMEGNKMMVAIPRNLIGHDTAEKDLDFKWADNISDNISDILTFISDGDVAPNGRFNYRFLGSKIVGVGGLAPINARHDVAFSAEGLQGALRLSVDGSSSGALVEVFSPAGVLEASVALASGDTAEPSLAPGIKIVRALIDDAPVVQRVVVK